MKCPFCKDPCGNSHCPYNEPEIINEDCEKEIKGLEQENSRLKEHIKKLEKYIKDRLINI